MDSSLLSSYALLSFLSFPIPPSSSSPSSSSISSDDDSFPDSYSVAANVPTDALGPAPADAKIDVFELLVSRFLLNIFLHNFFVYLSVPSKACKIHD